MLAVVRGPRTEMTASPAPKTSAAQIAPPGSPGGRVGHIHGVFQRALSASSATARYASGPIQDSEPPITAAESRPTPAIPKTFRRSAMPRDVVGMNDLDLAGSCRGPASAYCVPMTTSVAATPEDGDEHVRRGSIDLVSPDGSQFTAVDEGQGMPIVIVHPGAASVASWERVARHLSARFRGPSVRPSSVQEASRDRAVGHDHGRSR